MIESFIIMFILYSCVGILTSGSDLVEGHFTGIEHIFFPISEENGKYILMYMISNLSISLITILFLSKRCDQHKLMVCYELKHNNRVKLFWVQKFDMYKYLVSLFGAKFMIDLICILGFHSFQLHTFIVLSVSYFLTCILWLDTLYVLGLFNVNSSITFFIVTVLVFVSLLIQKTLFLTFFAYCLSIDFVFDYFVKGIVIILLQVLEIYKIKSVDFY